MNQQHFRFYYFFCIALLVLSVIFFVSFSVVFDNYSRAKSGIFTTSISRKEQATIALSDDRGRINYRKISINRKSAIKIEDTIQSLFDYPDVDGELRNYIPKGVKLLDFRIEGEHAYLTISDNFRNMQASQLSVAYAQVKNTIKLEYPEMTVCSIIYSDSVMDI